MMEQLMKRGREIGARRAAEMIALVEQAARDELPADIGVERGDGGVVLSGRGIVARLFGDARLRGLAALVRGMAR